MARKSLEEYITQINSSSEPEEAFRTFSKIIQDFGYDKLVYTLATNHPSIGLNSHHGLVVSYPEDWMKHYQNNSYLEMDPVHLQVLESPVPFFWQDLHNKKSVSKKSKILMHEADDAGLKDGVGIPLYGRYSEIAALGIARSQNENENSYENLAALQLLGTYFHETYKGLIKSVESPELTKKEQELLIWAAEGKSDQDIADILLISLPTVRYRWNRIFEKLNAYGRVYAITKAIRLQLIQPSAVRTKNYQKR